MLHAAGLLPPLVLSPYCFRRHVRTVRVSGCAAPAQHTGSIASFGYFRFFHSVSSSPFSEVIMATVASFVTVIFVVAALPSYSVSVPVQIDQRAPCPSGTVCASWDYCTHKNRASSLPNEVSYITCDYSGSEGVCCIVRSYPRTRRDEAYAEKPVSVEQAVAVPSDVPEQPATPLEQPPYEIPQDNLDTSTMTYEQVVKHYFGSFYQDVGTQGMVNPPPEVPPQKTLDNTSIKKIPALNERRQATTYTQFMDSEINPSETLASLPKTATQPYLSQANKKKPKAVRQQPSAPKKIPTQSYGPGTSLKGRSKGDDDYAPTERQSTIASNSPAEQQSEGDLKSRSTSPNGPYGQPKETARNPRRRTKSKKQKYQPRARSQESKYTQQQTGKSQSRPRARKDRNRKEGSNVPQSRKTLRKQPESNGEESTSYSEPKRRKPANKSGASRSNPGVRNGEGHRQKARKQRRKQKNNNYEPEVELQTQQRPAAKTSRKTKTSKQGVRRTQSQATEGRAQYTSEFTRREGKHQRSQENESPSRYGQARLPEYNKKTPATEYASRPQQFQEQYPSTKPVQDRKTGQFHQPTTNYRKPQEQQQPQYVNPAAEYSGYQANQRYSYQNRKPAAPLANEPTSDEVTFSTILSHNGPHIDFSHIPNALRHKQGFRSSFAESQTIPHSTHSTSSSNHSPNYTSQRKQQRKRSARFRDRQ